MTLRVGNDLKLYYNTNTHASPSWTEINLVGDVTVNLELGDAEVDLRATNWLLNLPAKLSGSIDVALASDVGGTVFNALRGFYFARTVKQYASAEADISGSGVEYFYAFCYFNSFPWGQPTQEMSSHDASLSLAYEEEASALVEPGWATTS